jgi:5-methylcytosine-specific restriction endonuclease McrA
VTKNKVDENIWKNYEGTPFNTYKSRAEQKKVEFTLTKEEFDILREKPCQYCERNYKEKVHINGIDRLDNSFGYTTSNCVSCCGDCNYAKGILDQRIFLQQCELVHKNNKVSSLEIKIPSNINMMKRN